jgi:flagellar biosynthetic protein FliR
VVPGPVKILFATALSLAVFPALVARGEINPAEALRWGASTGGIATTVALEAMFGLVMGYTAKLSFDAINFGGNLMGNFMGFAMASAFDPHQETQSQVVAEIQMALAMLVFLALDGHHLMLRASFDSYKLVGLGQAGIHGVLQARVVALTSQVIQFGIQIAAPVAVSLFAVNVAFGVMAKSMPNLNILVLSMSVSALLGLVIMLFTLPQFQSVTAAILERMGDQMRAVALALGGK